MLPGAAAAHGDLVGPGAGPEPPPQPCVALGDLVGPGAGPEFPPQPCVALGDLVGPGAGPGLPPQLYAAARAAAGPANLGTTLLEVAEAVLARQGNQLPLLHGTSSFAKLAATDGCGDQSE